MTEFPVRHFLSDDSVAHVGEGLLARTLPRQEWTHEAHLAATTYLVLKHPEIDLDIELKGIISRYNESAGTPNSDSEGYHDTITRAYLRGIREGSRHETLQKEYLLFSSECFQAFHLNAPV